MRPKLFERPILKLGHCLVQLPWLVGMQNNSTAAINNLRRLRARRGEVREETQRIEACLAKALEARGFRVLLNWNPPMETHGNVGEVDVICVKDGIVFVIEVKSTFIRKSQRDAWLHATTTLRKAGQQLQCKVAAVLEALAQSSDLVNDLGLGCLEACRRFTGGSSIPRSNGTTTGSRDSSSCRWRSS